MPVQLGLVLAVSQHAIGDDPAARAARTRRGGGPAARSRRARPRRSRSPATCTTPGVIRAAAEAQWNGPAGSDCVAPVEDQRVVQARRSEAIAERRIDRVAGRAGVDEQRPAGHGQRHRQGVGVGVAAVQIAVRPGVEHQVVAAPGAADGVAAVAERRRRNRRVGRRGRRSSISGAAARHPHGLLGRRTHGERRIAEQPGGQRQRVAGVGAVAAADRQQLAAVVVADPGQVSAIVGDGPREAGQPPRRFGEGPRVVAGQPRHRQRQQVEVQRVAVVVERSLDVAAVGADLARHLLDQDAASELGPRRRAAQLGQRAAGDVEGERLAEQMGVGAEVGRQVLLDEAAAARSRPSSRSTSHGCASIGAAVVRGRRRPAGSTKNSSAQIHDSDRSASSSMLAQLIPTSGGLASIQLARWRTNVARAGRCPASHHARPSARKC